MRLLGYPGWLLRCCYGVARVLGVVARVPEVVAKVLLYGCYGTLVAFCYAVSMQLLGYSGWLLGYPGWLLRCCYAVTRVPGGCQGLLCGCYGTWVGC